MQAECEELTNDGLALDVPPSVPDEEEEQCSSAASSKGEEAAASIPESSAVEEPSEATSQEDAKGPTPDGEEEEEEESSVDEWEETKKWLEELVRENLIVYVTKTRCPFCAEARNVMSVAEVDALEINIDEMDEEKAETLQRVIETTTKRYGVPVIWVDGETKDVAELKDLYQAGRLQQFLDTRRHINTDDTAQAQSQEVVVARSESVQSSITAISLPDLPECAVPEEYTSLRPVVPLCLGVGEALREEALAIDGTNMFVVLGGAGLHDICKRFSDTAFQSTELAKVYASHGVSRGRLCARLMMFLCERFGGPVGVSQCPLLRDTPSIYCCPGMLRLAHLHVEMDNSTVELWLSCMAKAVRQASIPRKAIPLLDQYFSDTAWCLVRHQEQQVRSAIR
eukprot:TRINITY_DN3868_c0_g4_i1.p1 TRINITY_DN3868_c0_g4~~TRINITY_DN3868_c0_g4_i1.p1  ORF type:complete len:456 (+),score=142.67 TRINITY_DN3868_c0_g4_i1:178-1368(+)